MSVSVSAPKNRNVLRKLFQKLGPELREKGGAAAGPLRRGRSGTNSGTPLSSRRAVRVSHDLWKERLSVTFLTGDPDVCSCRLYGRVWVPASLSGSADTPGNRLHCRASIEVQHGISGAPTVR